MMDTETLISTLRERNVRLWIEEGRIKCAAPSGTLDPEIRSTLAARKTEVMAFLQKAEALKSASPAIVPIKPGGRLPPLFAVSGHGGDVFWLLPLARQLDPEQPVLGVRTLGLDGSAPLTSVEAIARYQVEQIRRHRPNGPYLIAGHCAGGTIAYEVAQQLTAAGQEVALLALIGSPFPTAFRRLRMAWSRLGHHAKNLASGSLAERRQYVGTKLTKLLTLLYPQPAPAGASPALHEARRRVESATMAAVRAYKPRYFAGQLDLFVSGDKWHESHRWRTVAPALSEHSLGNFEIDSLLLGPDVRVLAALLQERLDLANSA